MAFVPPRLRYTELEPPVKRVVKSNLNTLSLTDDSVTSQSYTSSQPVPKPRSSQGAPAVSRRIRARVDTPFKSQSSQEFQEFAEGTGLASLTNVPDILSPKRPPRKAVKQVEFVDGVQKVSYSPESQSERYNGLNLLGDSGKQTSDQTARKGVSRQARLKDGNTIFEQSTDFETFAAGSIQGFDGDTQGNAFDQLPGRPKRATKSVEFKGGKSMKADSFSDKGFSFVDQNDRQISLRVPERKKKSVSKKVEFTGGKRQIEFSDEFQDQGISGLYNAEDLLEKGRTLVVPPRKYKPTSKSVDLKDGPSQVGYNEDFEEITLSSLYTPRDEDNTITDTPRSVQMPYSKAIEIKGGQKSVTKSEDFEAFSSGALKSLTQEVEEAVVMTPTRPSRKIDLNRTSKLSERHSSEFEPATRTLDLGESETFLDSVVTESKERGVTSWVEFREGKKHVRHSDERENFSLGEAMEYTKTDQKPTRSDVHKRVIATDGKNQVRNSDEFSNTMDYTDDFDSVSASWAVKVPISPRYGKTSKQVELKEGKLKVSFSGELDNKLTESIAESFDYSHSFEEVTVEDLESYSEQFDSVSLTPRALDRSRSSSAMLQPYTMAEIQSSISTQTPITSINTSIRTSIPTSIHSHTSMPVDEERSVDKTTRTSLSQLYTESFESSGFLQHSQTSSGFLHTHTYSDTWQSDITESSARMSPRYRKKLGIDRLDVSESEDEYTMTFTQSTAREELKSGSEESLAEKRAAVTALDSFVNNKMRLLRNPPKPAPKVERLKEDKLAGQDAKALKKFVKSRVSVLRESNVGEEPLDKATLTPCQPSASCQLRGLSEKENVEDYGISRLMIGRLKAENTLANMKKAAKVKLHVPEKCKHCRGTLAQLAAEQFMWHKKALVSEKLVHEKMEMQILQLQDPMWLFAEALRGLPKVTDDPDEVYYKLMRPLFDTYAGRYNESLAPS